MKKYKNIAEIFSQLQTCPVCGESIDYTDKLDFFSVNLHIPQSTVEIIDINVHTNHIKYKHKNIYIPGQPFKGDIFIPYYIECKECTNYSYMITIEMNCDKSYIKK